VPKRIAKLLAGMREHPKSVRFSDALAVAEHYFGPARISGSHHVFKTPWPGDPRVNQPMGTRSQGTIAFGHAALHLVSADQAQHSGKSADLTPGNAPEIPI
jgi:hypothetical protein